MDDALPRVKAPEPARPPEPPKEPELVAIIMVVGPDGAKPRRWMTGPTKWLRGGYDFKPCCPTLVYPEDAKKLLGNGPELDGRVFARAEDANVPRPKG